MSPKIILPAISVFSLLLYYAIHDFFTVSSFKFIYSLFSLILISSDLLYIQFIKKDEQLEEKKLRQLTSIFGISSFVLYQIRSYFEFSAPAGISENATSIPKIRDLLLLFTVISALSFILLSILVWISKNPSELRFQLKDRKLTLLKNTLFSFFWISPLVIAVNYFAVMKNYSFDLSNLKKFSFSTTSKQILKDVKKEITVTAFFPRPLEADGKDESLSLSYIRPEVEILLDQLKSTNPNFTVKFINAEVEKELLGDFTNVSNGMILFRSLKTSVDINGSAYNEEKVVLQNKKDLEDIERKIVQAVINVSSPKKKVYFTVSNGERYGINFQNINDEQISKFISILTFYNYSINELGLSQGWPNKIPEDADLLAIIGPTISFDETSKSTLQSFIEKNGKVFISIEPNGAEDFNWLLNQAGISLKKENLRQVEGRLEILANKFQTHPIEELIISKEKGVLYLANAFFETSNSIPPKYTYTNVLESGFGSFLDLNKNGKLDKEEKQNSYPIFTVITSKQNEEEKNSLTPISPTRIAVFSGTNWLTNRYIQYNLNSILAINTMNWLNQSVLTERILLKKEEPEIVTLNDKQKLIIWLFGLFIFPIFVTSVLAYYSYSKRKKV
jgi:hypothetical protein